MAISTFAPEVAPSPGTQRSPEVSLTRASFGDGYTQAAPKGLNHIRRTLSLKWDGLTPVQIAALESFMVEQGGYKPFYFTHLPEGVRRKWTCDTWSASFGTPATFSCTLREDFSNVS